MFYYFRSHETGIGGFYYRNLLITPTITTTSDDTPANGSTLTLVGESFETAQGTGGVTAGGVGWTETTWSDSSVNVVVALGSNKYGVNVPLVITNNSGGVSTSYNIQIQPASGVNYVNLSGTLAASNDRITATSDIASGDQVEWSNVVGGVIGDVTVNPDGSFNAASGVTSFDVRVNDGTGWGTVGTQTTAPDTTAPTISSATIESNGTSLTLVFSEPVRVGSGGSGGFTFSVSGGAATATYSSGSGFDTLTYTLSRTISNTETLAKINYSQPGNGIEDAAGNDLSTFVNFSVTNNSTQNSAPTDIYLTSATVLSTAGVNAVVGQLSSVDADFADTHTYSLVAGTGSTNNASFNISGALLRCSDPAATGVGSYSVRVRSTDSASNTFEKAFNVYIAAAASVSSYTFGTRKSKRVILS